MEFNKAPSRKVKSSKNNAFKVMKLLSEFTKEDLSTSTPLRVTYIANKKAKIVKCD